MSHIYQAASDSLPIIQYVIETEHSDILTTNEVINGRSSPEIWPEVIPGKLFCSRIPQKSPKIPQILPNISFISRNSLKSAKLPKLPRNYPKLPEIRPKDPEIPQFFFSGSNKYAENVTMTKTDSLEIELEENRAKKIAELQSLSDQDLLHKMQKLKQRAYRLNSRKLRRLNIFLVSDWTKRKKSKEAKCWTFSEILNIKSTEFLRNLTKNCQNE